MKTVVLIRARPSRVDGTMLVSAEGASPTKQQPELRVQVRDILSHKDLSDLQRDPDVEAAAPSMPIRLISTASLGMPLPVESRDSAAWGIKAVGASDSARTGKGVKVAILDTGLCRSHPAFKDPDIRVTPRNFVGGDPLDVTDFDGHGTHCAGVIFGRDVDGMRIGVARGITDVLIGKVVGGEGPTLDGLADAINWAHLEGAHVLSMSLGIDFEAHRQAFIDQGMPGPQATSMALVDYAACIRLFDRLAEHVGDRHHTHRGMLIVAAAGNESNRPIYRVKVAPPAGASGVLSVGAVGMGGRGQLEVAAFSNHGPWFCAPGVGIVSASKDGGLESRDGTSMAVPHVAGVAALWAQARIATSRPGTFEADRVLRDIEDHLKRIEGADPDDVGGGLVQAPG
ncbi:MAG: S8 family serine peptidase [Betaproteobacteria bacterium]|nr:S8 family serine peptidase [Betaproteobacteria bacterium]MBK7518457.1 S8 family serine peptidase [Betaproteobacteria bacterium]MBK7616267.1 S8 family serine peptidase [Burkholderiales bacterium]MBK8104031.1 S8 family serine peptidase [Betaproteobacteria bacterium]MBK8865854.1 S8 family serine peptidase [Betaproteobacteria bacterium]